MRNLINLVEGLWNSAAPRYDSKPSYMVPMEDGPDTTLYPVWLNPSRNTYHKIIAHSYSQARGIIYRDSKLLIWDHYNLFHSDVYNYLGGENGSGDFITMTFGTDWVAAKGVDSEPSEFTDPVWLPIIKQAVSRYYPNGVKIEEFDWG